ncbi:MAG: ribonuclease III [Elusimicrobiota bacterium]|jgi:ribonuclease-3|nr:ribonuclease III [Elusimicrobiota bacterium]
MLTNHFDKFQKIIDYKFKNVEILKTALTHSSYASEFVLRYNNERMEFLGDSVLGFVVVESLYKDFPEYREGELSRLKSKIVSAHNLSIWAKEVSLGDFVLLGKGQNTPRERMRPNLLSNSFEAVICAIYLDGGIESARKFILRFLHRLPVIDMNDFKSKLQEIAQSQYAILPEYKVLKETGPEHNKCFEMAVYLKKKLLGTGTGYSKKEAEQIAAQQAISNIKGMKL